MTKKRAAPPTVEPTKKKVATPNVDKSRTARMDKVFLGRSDKAMQVVNKLEKKIEREPGAQAKLEQAWYSAEYWNDILVGHTPDVKPTGDTWIFR